MNPQSALRPRFKVFTATALCLSVGWFLVPGASRAQEASTFASPPRAAAASPGQTPSQPRAEPAAASGQQARTHVAARPSKPVQSALPSAVHSAVQSAGQPGGQSGASTRTGDGPAAPTATNLPAPGRPTPTVQVAYGLLQCDGGQQLALAPSKSHPGYVEVNHRASRWLMRQVATETGAVRLEDVRGQALLVQIPAKTMLLNPQSGQRLLDGCATESQRRERPAIDPGRPSRASLLQ